MPIKILVVDDEKDITEFIQYNLEQEGFDVITAFNGLEAISKLEENPDLIVLDIMMPKMNGFEVLKKIRDGKKYNNIPVLFLSAKSSEQDEITGLEIGADDYIHKPVSIKKIIARINSNLRQRQTSKDTTDELRQIIVGNLKIDRDEYVIFLSGEKIILPRKEFEIISYLATKPGKVFPRDRILRDVWGTDVYVGDRTIDVHIRKIREKLGDSAKMIETVKGVGYRLKSDEV